MTHPRLLPLIILCTGLAACAAPIAPEPTLIPVVLETPSITPTSTVPPTKTPSPTPPRWPAFDESMSLPAPLYYIRAVEPDRRDGCPTEHLIRLDPLGGAASQIGPCFIWDGINGFDINPVDGSIVLAAQGALWRMNADGENSTLLIEATPNREIEGAAANIKEPIWSPDGTHVAYSDGGIRILEVSTGQRIDVIENQCFDDNALGIAYPPCFYNISYSEPQWSPNSNTITFTAQTADYFYQLLYVLDSDELPLTLPGSLTVYSENITWSGDSSSLYFYALVPGEADFAVVNAFPSFMRYDVAADNTEVLWAAEDLIDTGLVAAGNPSFSVRYPFVLSDGRILYFHTQSCDSRSCYTYALAEYEEGQQPRILHRDVLPPSTREVVWHESGEFAAFRTGSNGGPNHIVVLRVSTGESFVIYSGDNLPTNLVWGVS